MTDNHTIQLAAVPIGGKDGAVWNHLHAEREDICEALLKCFEPASDAHYQELQARLRSIDDALDRLMSGFHSGSSDGVIIEDLNSFDTILVRTHRTTSAQLTTSSVSGSTV